VDFYTRVLGLRLIAKSVNQDDPTHYHLFFGDELAHPGADMTFFEYRGAHRGRAGVGMVHRIVWRVESADSIEFWAARFSTEQVRHERIDDAIRFSDGEGLDHELVIRTFDDPPLTAVHPEVPAEHAIQGFEGVRAYSHAPARSEQLLIDLLGGRRLDDGRIELRGDARGGWVAFDEAPSGPAVQGAGTVHHVAFATRDGENDAWLDRIEDAGIQSSGHVDRHYFESIYFREPGGILYELATDGPGFTVDGPIEELGIRTILPPFLESHRAEIEPRLTQLEDPRELWPDDALARAAEVHATHPTNAGVGSTS
jgi:glyoxalase family protein